MCDFKLKISEHHLSISGISCPWHLYNFSPVWVPVRLDSSGFDIKSFTADITLISNDILCTFISSCSSCDYHFPRIFVTYITFIWSLTCVNLYVVCKISHKGYTTEITYALFLTRVISSVLIDIE